MVMIRMDASRDGALGGDATRWHTWTRRCDTSRTILCDSISVTFASAINKARREKNRKIFPLKPLKPLKWRKKKRWSPKIGIKIGIKIGRPWKGKRGGLGEGLDVRCGGPRNVRSRTVDSPGFGPTRSAAKPTPEMTRWNAAGCVVFADTCGRQKVEAKVKIGIPTRGYAQQQHVHGCIAHQELSAKKNDSASEDREDSPVIYLHQSSDQSLDQETTNEKRACTGRCEM